MDPITNERNQADAVLGLPPEARDYIEAAVKHRRAVRENRMDAEPDLHSLRIEAAARLHGDSPAAIESRHAIERSPHLTGWAKQMNVDFEVIDPVRITREKADSLTSHALLDEARDAREARDILGDNPVTGFLHASSRYRELAIRGDDPESAMVVRRFMVERGRTIIRDPEALAEIGYRAGAQKGIVAAAIDVRGEDAVDPTASLRAAAAYDQAAARTAAAADAQRYDEMARSADERRRLAGALADDPLAAMYVGEAAARRERERGGDPAGRDWREALSALRTDLAADRIDLGSREHRQQYEEFRRWVEPQMEDAGFRSTAQKYIQINQLIAEAHSGIPPFDGGPKSGPAPLDPLFLERMSRELAYEISRDRSGESARLAREAPTFERKYIEDARQHVEEREAERAREDRERLRAQRPTPDEREGGEAPRRRSRTRDDEDEPPRRAPRDADEDEPPQRGARNRARDQDADEDRRPSLTKDTGRRGRVEAGDEDEPSTRRGRNRIEPEEDRRNRFEPDDGPGGANRIDEDRTPSAGGNRIDPEDKARFRIPHAEEIVELVDQHTPKALSPRVKEAARQAGKPLKDAKEQLHAILGLSKGNSLRPAVFALAVDGFPAWKATGSKDDIDDETKRISRQRAFLIGGAVDRAVEMYRKKYGNEALVALYKNNIKAIEGIEAAWKDHGILNMDSDDKRRMPSALAHDRLVMGTRVIAANLARNQILEGKHDLNKSARPFVSAHVLGDDDKTRVPRDEDALGIKALPGHLRRNSLDYDKIAKREEQLKKSLEGVGRATGQIAKEVYSKGTHVVDQIFQQIDGER